MLIPIPDLHCNESTNVSRADRIGIAQRGNGIAVHTGKLCAEGSAASAKEAPSSQSPAAPVILRHWPTRPRSEAEETRTHSYQKAGCSMKSESVKNMSAAVHTQHKTHPATPVLPECNCQLQCRRRPLALVHLRRPERHLLEAVLLLLDVLHVAASHDIDVSLPHWQ